MRPEPPSISAALCNATALRKASRRVSALYDEALKDIGLKTTQFAILAELGRRDDRPPTMRELADALVMDRSGLGHNLRPLERDAYLEFREGEQDRRRRHVVLTQKGRDALARGRALWRRAQDRFDAVYGAEAAAALRKILLGLAEDARLSRLQD